MKLQRLHIKNFKSIVDLEIVEPNPFTVFVGPNGSGKSNIFEALEFASSLSLENDIDKQVKIQEQFGGLESFSNKKLIGNPTFILYEFIEKQGILFGSIPKTDEVTDVIAKTIKDAENQQEVLNELLLNFAKEKGSSISLESFSNERLKRAKKLLSPKYQSINIIVPIHENITQLFSNNNVNLDFFNIVSAFNDIVNKPEFDLLIEWFSRIFVGKRIGDKTKYTNHLRTDASNLEKVLVRILKDDKKKAEIVEWLQLFIPEFENIEFRKNQINGRTELQIFEKFSTEPFNKSLLSDGTYNILALLTAVYQSDEPQFLCIEEPENGLNPYVIAKLVDLFRAACEEKGHWIWLNTHSNTLVECLTPEEVIVVDKIDGETKIKQIKGMNLHGLSMAEVWLSGALGGGTPW